MSLGTSKPKCLSRIANIDKGRQYMRESGAPFVLIVIILFSHENIMFVPMEMKTSLSSI